ncbi:phosphorylase family protein [Croceimicrobium hydrocarbonivorans]|uniref:Phosphorylase n=1 Tax=Croceimicrobium hydrocarbonivorans TaxID=2761580 RepID=A0A7H0VCQ2_9FLAO|nr:phosphorylase [Croceimicrobium hydrocarbonivorans]QNR23500.1 phosphorylase [Croceimicrobium hydrocarbonivorans]
MPASEIILNPDLSVYHLHLKNGEVPRKVVTVGDPDRIDWLIPHFDQVYSDQQFREFRSLRGSIGQQDMLCISTGIGTDNVDIVLNELHLAYAWDLSKRELQSEELAPMQVLRLGTSGTLREDIPIDSILMSEAALGFDYLMHFYNWPDFRKLEGLEAFPEPYFTWGSEEMRDQFRSMAQHSGITVTANGFYGPQGRNLPLKAKNANWLDLLAAQKLEGRSITNLEMETAGIYALGSLLNMECLSLSAILANRRTQVFSKKPETIVQGMIAQALEIYSAE